MPALAPAAGSVPALGSTFVLRLANLPAAPGIALLLQGTRVDAFAGAALPLALDGLGMPGCDLWLAPEPALSIPVLHRGGTADVALRIPTDPRLAGLGLAAQALTLDARAPHGVGALSNGGLARVH